MSGAKASRKTTIKLPDELISALDAEAARTGESRSDLVRRAVQEYLDDRSSADIGLRIAEGYRRMPPEVPDAWGELQAMTSQSTLELLQRLDEEERQAGFDPW